MTSMPLLVQPLYEGLELIDVAAGGIACVRREIADCVIAPVITQSILHQVTVADKTVYRHQLHGGDAQLS